MSDNATVVIDMLATIVTSEMPIAVNGIHGFWLLPGLPIDVEACCINGLINSYTSNQI